MLLANHLAPVLWDKDVTTAAWRVTYSRTDWRHDDGAKTALPCPRCGRDEDYGPRTDADGRKPPELVRYYRACKVCGMFQQADGASLPYETRMHVHVCLSRVAVGAACRGCGGAGDGRPWHVCPRIIPIGEAFTCEECGTRITEEHTIPWPEAGPWT